MGAIFQSPTGHGMAVTLLNCRAHGLWRWIDSSARTGQFKVTYQPGLTGKWDGATMVARAFSRTRLALTSNHRGFFLSLPSRIGGTEIRHALKLNATSRSVMSNREFTALELINPPLRIAPSLLNVYRKQSTPQKTSRCFLGNESGDAFLHYPQLWVGPRNLLILQCNTLTIHGSMPSTIRVHDQISTCSTALPRSSLAAA